MAAITLFLLIMMILLNTAGWLFPHIIASKGGYGLGFSLTDNFINNSNVDVALLPKWQVAGAIILSSIPLIALGFGLYHLHKLFQAYAQKAYFSVNAATQLGNVGKSIVIWTLLNLACGPLLSVWLTMREPVGQRFITLSFSVQDIVALFLAACITIIAYILKQASQLHSENQEFI